MRVYYLTGSQFGISNIALRRIKIARFADLNDPFELLAVNLRDKKHRKAFRNSKKDINEKKGLICFCDNWNNPVIWSHYAEKHSGIALGFEIPDNQLIKVDYIEKRLKVKLDERTGSPKLTEDVINLLLRTKSKHWEYEGELRIIINLIDKEQETGLYFHDYSEDFQLREVILGPRCNLPINNVRRIVSDYKPPVEVIKARMAQGVFSVVKDKRQSRV